MEQKVEFICEWRTQKYSITELCKAFIISRPTAYKLINCFQNEHLDGLVEQSRTPRAHPNKTDEAIEEKIIQLIFKSILLPLKS